jgi:hypothetical protein
VCTCLTHKKEQEYLDKPKFRLADYFNANWDKYLLNPTKPITYEQYNAVAAMRVCHTAALGVDYFTCEECGDTKEVYHTCKNRFCPTCSWRDTMKWASRIKQSMLNISHRHVVFTLPHALIPLAKGNGKYLLNILLQTASDTFKDWALEKYNIKIGVISVLHTFGETKDYHLHVHMIVSWGGINQTTGELFKIEHEFVNYSFLQKKFRIKFENSLIAMFDEKTLRHEFVDRQEFMNYINKINGKNWQIHLEPPMDTPTAVIRYIGRYSKRACMSESKITKIEDEFISFRYKDYTDLDKNNNPIEKELTLHYSEFFPRLLQHVPIPYFRLVRYYGLYSNSSVIPEQYLNKEIELAEIADEQILKESTTMCETCKCERVYQFSIIDRRLPKERTEIFNINLHAHQIYQRA